jgi:hypothetical protein
LVWYIGTFVDKPKAPLKCQRSQPTEREPPVYVTKLPLNIHYKAPPGPWTLQKQKRKAQSPNPNPNPINN